MSAARRVACVAAAVAVLVASALVPWHDDARIRAATGLVAATLLLWITEVAPLGVVALWVPVAATLSGVLSWKAAVECWGDPIVMLFLGAFLLARALDKHGAFDFLARASQHTWLRRGGAAGLALAVLVVSGGLSTMQNNTAVAAMLLPITVTLARGTRAPAIVVLALSYGATMGGMATPVGTAPNFIGYAAMKKLDAGMTFLTWLRVGIPVWIGTTLLGWGVLCAAGRLSGSGVARRATRAERWMEELASGDVGPETRRLAASSTADPPSTSPATTRSAGGSPLARRAAMIAFGASAAVWLGTGVVLSLTPEGHAANAWVKTYLPESLVPIVAALALFIVPSGFERRTVLDRHDFQALDWDTLFLIAGGLCLGRVLEQSGTGRALADAVAAGGFSQSVLLLALGGITVLLSELTSNTATASLMVPIAGAIAPAVGLAPVKAIWLVALSASLGFALPVSTPPNAIVYSSRLVSLRMMAAVGLLVDAVSTVWVVWCIQTWG
ncbi:MAG: hypothetical protein CHACPFDD_03210 [Phycisphaerae bacterium]|nr:hypothetical protein [Phycisphaerae bacterium]